MMRTTIAIAVLSWNRPHYLSRFVESLSGSGSFDYDLHVFQEGGAGIDPVLALWDEVRHPKKYLHQADRHIGLPRNVARAMELLEDYDGLFLLEDDFVLMPGFFQTGEALAARGKEALGRPVIAQQWQRYWLRDWTMEQTEQLLGDSSEWQIAVDTCGNFMGGLIPRSLWLKIRESWREYSRVAQGEGPLIQHDQAVEFGGRFTSPAHWRPGGAHDVMLRRMAYDAGVAHLTLRVRRMENVGDQGLTCVPWFWTEREYHRATAHPVSVPAVLRAIQQGILRDASGDTEW